MFKGATLGSDIFLGSLGAEASTGQVELIAGELAIMGAIIAARKIKQAVQHKRDSKHKKEDDKHAAEEAAAEAIRQAELESQARAQELAREQQAREMQIEQERQAELERQRQAEALRQQQRTQNIAAEQTALNQARINQNEADIQRAQHYVQSEERNMEVQREERLQQDMHNASPWLMDGSVPSSSGYNWWNSDTYAQINNPAPEDDEYQRALDIINGGYVYEEPELTEEQKARQAQYDAEQRQGQNPPDGGDDGPNGGNGGGMPSGPGGPGRPGGNGRLPNRTGPKPEKNNPYFDILSEIAKQIQNQKNKEKKSVQKAENEDQFKDDQTGNMPGEGGSGTEQSGIIGGNPATWTPINNGNNPATQGNDYPGKNGAGTLQPEDQLTEEAKGQAVLDNQHLIQQEIEAMIAAQGSGELTAEEQLTQLNIIDQKLDTIVPKQTKITPGSIFTSQISRF